MSLPVDVPADEALDLLSRFRVDFYESLYARADALFELTDSVLCAGGPVNTLVELSLTAEHRRGHGALYSALDRGWIEVTRLRRALAELPLPKAADGRIVLAVDVATSTDAATAARTSSFRAGHTPSSPCWSPAALLGVGCWTPCVSVLRTTPRS